MDKNLQQLETKILKIAFVGPESTGKTSLSKALATIFDSVWVEEYARDYLQKKWDSQQKGCEPSDLLPIVQGQLALENEKVAQANKYLFCDTNSFVTFVYAKIYFQEAPDWLKKCAKNHHYDFCFLTDIDVPWENDDLRDAPNKREEHLEIFEHYLIKYGQAYVKISGSLEQRIEQIKSYLQDLELALSIGISSFDYCQLLSKGLSVQSVYQHLEQLKNGTVHVKLNRMATHNDGIHYFNENQWQYYESIFIQNIENYQIAKFVPASGAATRMFQFLQEFLNDFDFQKETLNNYINRKKAKNLNLFFLTLNKFSFYDLLMNEIRQKVSNYDQLEKSHRAYLLVDFLISENGLNFASLPKAVIPFHQKNDKFFTPINEHLFDFKNLIYPSKNHLVHFTISENHLPLFVNEINKFNANLESGINVSLSFQKNYTNTLAFSKNYKPFKITNELVIRPSGHGALLENLNQLANDIVFIQNIDNVSLHNKKSNFQIKRALAGFLLEIQSNLFKMQEMIEQTVFTEEMACQLKEFLINQFKTDFDDLFDGLKLDFKKEILHKLLFKPIRVCGMVRNEGETGGGPFWVINDKGYVELQIVEASQINMKDEKQAQIFNESTHFNPVDMVCSIKNYNGTKYNLLDFVDKNTGFIVEKQSNGKSYLAYELPGLWNGSMAKWHTIFVDVPLFTFNPVKSVIDLLKPNHQEHAFEI